MSKLENQIENFPLNVRFHPNVRLPERQTSQTSISPNIRISSKHQTFQTPEFQTSDYPMSDFSKVRLDKHQTFTNIRLLQTSDFSKRQTGQTL